MKQEQFDKIVDLAYHIYGNDYEGGFVSRASIDQNLAALTRTMEDSAIFTPDEIDNFVLPYLGGEIDNEGNPIRLDENEEI